MIIEFIYFQFADVLIVIELTHDTADIIQQEVESGIHSNINVSYNICINIWSFFGTVQSLT